MDDLTISTVHTALRGLSQRQKVISNNIANVETPGYTAQKVSFEDSLRAAVRQGAPQYANLSVTPVETPANINGNNVQLDDETMSLVDTGLQYQLMVEAMNSKFGLLRTAMGRGA
ncbi:MAG: flagellar basal-body rod protein [Actinomycetia bacterium]|nr:flagellar basal-body rod protein [Actinomycetes bacterium]